MKLFFKILFGLLILILIAAVTFAFIFNPNDYKDDVISLFKENTGRQLKIPGDISLSLFPWVGLELGKIEVSNARGFAKKPFAKMTRLQVRVKLWPLLQQRLEADTLIIEGLSLNLAKNKHGKTNWNDLLQTKKSTTPSTQAASSSQTQDIKPDAKINLLAAFAINGIKIKQAQFNWHDQQLKQKTSIKNIQLEIGKLQVNSKIPFSSEFEIQQADLQAKVNFQNKISFSNDFKEFSFYDTKLNTEIKLASLKQKQDIKLASKLIILNLDKQTVRSKKLTLATNDAKVNMQFVAKNLSSKPNIKAQLNLETLNPRLLVKSFDIALPDMADKNAFTKFNAKFDVSASMQKLSLSKVNLTLDDTQITGKANIKLPLASTVALNINAINLDRYLPTPVVTKNKNETKKQSKNKALETVLVPIALLTKVDLVANLKINTLQVKNTHWKNVQFVANAKKGDVKIQPIKLQGYGSTIDSSLNIKTSKTNALLTASLNIKDMKSGQLLKDFMNVKNLQGLASINANISTQGIKLSQLKQNLNGMASFKLKNGIVKGFDLEHEINKLDAKIKRKAAPATPSPLQTKFTNMSASAIIKNGVIHNKDLRAATPFTRVIGQGNVSLPKETLNYVATVKLTNSRDIESKKSFEKMSAVPLDIYIRGTFDKPQIKADFSKALKMIVKKELKKHEQKLKEEAKAKIKLKKQQMKEKAKLKEQEIKEQVKEKLKKKLGDKLKNLFKF